MGITRRNLIRWGAGSALPGGLLAACGGDGSEPDGSADDAETAIEVVEEVIPLEPTASALELVADPLMRVQGSIRIQVIQDGLPVPAASLEGLGSDGQLCFAGVTDAQGAFVWEGARTLGLQVRVDGPQGPLSLYLLEDTTLNLAPLVVNVVTTLADRVRQARQWLPSQADVRVHQFLSIPFDTPLAWHFADSAEFSHAQFARARQASGLSQHAYLDRLARQAAADDYAAHALGFAPEPALGLVPSSVLEGVNLLLGFGLNVLDRNLSDEQKLGFFGGLLVHIGLLHDDPTLKIVTQIVERLDDMQRTLDQILKEVYNAQLIGLRQNIKKLDDAVVAIQAQLVNPALQENPEVQRARVIELIEQTGLTDGTLPLLIVKEFIGGMGSTFGLEDRVYPVLFKRENGIDAATGTFLSGIAADARVKFYSKSKEGVYEDALHNILVLYAVGMSWALSYRAGKASEVRGDARAFNHQVVLLQAAAREMVTITRLLGELGGFTRLPDESVFLNIEDNLAWFNSRAYITGNPAFHGGWHAWDGSWDKGRFKPWSQGNLRMAYTHLPLAVQAMGESPDHWGPPSSQQVDATFFAPLQKTGHKNIETYATAHGAPATGVYLVNEKGKPALTIWLSDLRLSENNWVMCDFLQQRRCTTPPGGEWFGKYRRGYARMSQREVVSGKDLNFSSTVREGDARIHEDTRERLPFAEYLESYVQGDPSTRGVVKLGNFDKDRNYYYPVNSRVKNVLDYYPWQVYRKLQAETGDFALSALYERYKG